MSGHSCAPGLKYKNLSFHRSIASALQLFVMPDLFSVKLCCRERREMQVILTYLISSTHTKSNPFWETRKGNNIKSYSLEVMGEYFLGVLGSTSIWWSCTVLSMAPDTRSLSPVQGKNWTANILHAWRVLRANGRASLSGYCHIRTCQYQSKCEICIRVKSLQHILFWEHENCYTGSVDDRHPSTFLRLRCENSSQLFVF